MSIVCGPTHGTRRSRFRGPTGSTPRRKKIQAKNEAKCSSSHSGPWPERGDKNCTVAPWLFVSGRIASAWTQTLTFMSRDSPPATFVGAVARGPGGTTVENAALEGWAVQGCGPGRDSSPASSGCPHKPRICFLLCALSYAGCFV